MRDRAKRGSSLSWVAPLLLALALGVAGVACGDDDAPDGSGSDPDAPMGSPPLPPSDPGDDLPDLPDNDDPTAVRCTGPPKGVFDATAVVGESLQRASAAAAAQGCSVREVIRDGESLAVTQDFRPDRVNVETERGEVIRIVDLG